MDRELVCSQLTVGMKAGRFGDCVQILYQLKYNLILTGQFHPDSQADQSSVAVWTPPASDRGPGLWSRADPEHLDSTLLNELYWTLVIQLYELLNVIKLGQQSKVSHSSHQLDGGTDGRRMPQVKTHTNSLCLGTTGGA